MKMSDHEVIAQIERIYDRFEVPEHIRQHMRDVAKVGEWVSEHWKGKTIDKPALKAALLLHDLGNILKIDFNNDPLGTAKKVSKDVQDRIRKKYGEDHHEATMNMAKELHLKELTLKILKEKESARINDVLNDSFWEAKIALYVDLRVAPKGIVSLQERMDEVKIRYGGTFVGLEEHAKKLEEQIFAHVEGSPEDIKVE